MYQSCGMSLYGCLRITTKRSFATSLISNIKFRLSVFSVDLQSL